MSAAQFDTARPAANSCVRLPKGQNNQFILWILCTETLTDWYCSVPVFEAADVRDQRLPPPSSNTHTHTYSRILLLLDPLSPIISDSDGIWSVVLFPEALSVFSAFCFLVLINSSDLRMRLGLSSVLLLNIGPASVHQDDEETFQQADED